jgi:uncharacterized protein
MSKTARVSEPSMEEILASIRRIIADDSGASQAASKAAPAPAATPSPVTSPAPGATNDSQHGDLDDLTASDEPSAEPDVLD